jgi:hypothetical protein
MATDEQLPDEHLPRVPIHIGCANHPNIDARSGGTVFPISKKVQPYLACRECVAEALRKGLPVRLYGEPLRRPPAPPAPSP